MTPGLLLAALRARWGVIVVLLLGTVASAAAVSMLLPKSYRATASLVVDTREEQSLSSALVPQRERVAYIQTQVDILTSEKVARKVVRDLRLADSGWARERYPGDDRSPGSIEDWLVERLLEWLKVETSQSNIINASFSFGDPEVAAQLANGFAKAYIDTVLELRVQPMRDAAEWFDEQLKTLRSNLERAQARLTEYHQQRGIVSADERLDVEFARLGELSTQLVTAQDETLELRTRERQTARVLARGGAPDQMSDVQANPHIQRLKGELEQAEAKLGELGTRYGINHPTYQSLLAETRGRRERLGVEMRKIVAGVANSKRQSQQHEGDLKAAITDQRARLLQLKESRNELAVLTRDVETAQKAYDTALQRFVVSQVESRANQANVALLSPAQAPRQPHRPRVLLNVALSTLVGLTLGVGVVILLEHSDRRVRSLADLQALPDVPLLGVLGTWNPSQRIARAAPLRIVRGLPGPG